MQWIEFIIRTIEMEMGHSTVIAALLAGLVTSWCITQGWKFVPAMKGLSDIRHRVLTRVIAFVTAAGPVASLWPLPGAPRWIWAIAVGVASPVAYTVAMRIAGHFWPWLANAASARPESDHG